MDNKTPNLKDKITAAIKKNFEGITLKKAALYFAVEFIFFALIIALDILTKIFVYGRIKETGVDIDIIKDVLVLTPVENTGASFGIFQNSTRILSIISIITVIAVIIIQVFSIKQRNFFLRAGVVMISAGGLGNLIDRFALGYVRDFIYFELIDFAVFNVADSSLTVGVILILIYVLFYYRPDGEKTKKTENEKLAP